MLLFLHPLHQVPLATQYFHHCLLSLLHLQLPHHHPHLHHLQISLLYHLAPHLFHLPLPLCHDLRMNMVNHFHLG
jgi:hypothetical protein